jgi:RNA polymerase sigma factor for flagellar operon FliA
MHDPQNPEILFLEHLGWIDRVSAMTCTQHGVWGPEAEDFAASVRLNLMADDYAIIRNHRGESSLRTYLATVVHRKFLDHWRRRRGRWRPSAMARRLGPPAPDLEALVYRDGWRLDQAGEKLRTSGRTTLSDRDLGRLLKQLPPREPLRRRSVATDEVPDTTEADGYADDGVTRAERRTLRDHVTGVLKRAMALLAPEDQVIVRMHFVDGRTLADVARGLDIEQKPLYRRIKRLRKFLRTTIEAAGVRGDDVQGMMEGEGS